MEYVLQSPEHLIEVLKEKRRCKLSVSRSKWYNGYTYMPLLKYIFTYSIGVVADVSIKYEHLVSEFNKSKAFGDSNDRHCFEILLQTNLKKEMHDFKVVKKGLIRGYLSPESKFDVKSKNIDLKDFLNQSYELNSIFDSTQNYFSSFEPAVSGKKKNDKFYVSFNFVIDVFNENLILNSLNFIESFVNPPNRLLPLNNV